MQIVCMLSGSKNHWKPFTIFISFLEERCCRNPSLFFSEFPTTTIPNAVLQVVRVFDRVDAAIGKHEIFHKLRLRDFKAGLDSRQAQSAVGFLSVVMDLSDLFRPQYGIHFQVAALPPGFGQRNYCQFHEVNLYGAFLFHACHQTVASAFLSLPSTFTFSLRR